MTIKFGTDGWRAIIARDFTFNNVQVCALGVARLLKKTGLASRGLVVGYDNRFASDDFAIEVAQTVASEDVKVYLAQGAAPTPVISYNIVHLNAGGAAIITASHNPAKWNGFKYRPETAGSAPPEVISELEKEIALIQKQKEPIRLLPIEKAQSQGLVEYIDPTPAYISNLRRTMNFNGIETSGLKITTDAMYGPGAGYLSSLLSKGNASVTELHKERNPLFPGIFQPEPTAINLQALGQEVVKQGSDVGIALDGDADRLGIVDETGNFVTTLKTFALLCLYQLEILGKRGPLVRSINMTSMIDRLGKAYDVPVFDTPVGFKYLGPVMMRENALAAGEESGGYAFRGGTIERDGIISSLMFLDLMAKTEMRPSQLVAWLEDKVGPHHYERRDVPFLEHQRSAIQCRVTKSLPDRLAGLPVTGIDARDGYRYELPSGYWALLRFSGTEPLIRIYAESESPDQTQKLLNALVEIAGL